MRLATRLLCLALLVLPGKAADLRVVRAGYEPLPARALAVAPEAGGLRGVVLAASWRAGGPQTAVCGAEVRIALPEREVTCATDSAGRFEVELPGDGPMVAVDPIVLQPSAALADRLRQADQRLNELAARGYDVSCGQGYLNAADAALAVDGAAVGALPDIGHRMALMAGYTTRVDEQSAEARGWITESLKTGTDQIAVLIGLTRLLDRLARLKMAEQYAPEAWHALRERLLTALVAQLGTQIRHGFAVAREHGIEVDESWADTIETALRVSLDAKGSAAELGTRALQAYLLRSVDQALAGAMRARLQAELNRTLGALAAGRAPLGEAGLAAAEEHYKAFEAEHRQLNLTTLDRQRWRLNAKLVADTFGAGLGAYLGLKDFLNPANWGKLKGLDLKTFGALQEALLRGGSLVDKTVAGVDLAFQGYQGYLWFTDAARARWTLQQIGAALAPVNEPTAP